MIKKKENREKNRKEKNKEKEQKNEIKEETENKEISEDKKEIKELKNEEEIKENKIEDFNEIGLFNNSSSEGFFIERIAPVLISNKNINLEEITIDESNLNNTKSNKDDMSFNYSNIKKQYDKYDLMNYKKSDYYIISRENEDKEKRMSLVTDSFTNDFFDNTNLVHLDKLNLQHHVVWEKKNETKIKSYIDIKQNDILEDTKLPFEKKRIKRKNFKLE
ncbi:MAG: hypothetical protein QW117_03295 [Candidatus Pacearchaeota archaeon]